MNHLPELKLALLDAYRCEIAYKNPTERFSNEQLLIENSQDGNHIAIAGSNDRWDWWQNLSAWKPWIFQRYVYGTSFKATAGYAKAAKRIVKHLVDNRLIQKGEQIFLTGHSAGGAKAPLVSAILYVMGYKVAPPRVFASPKWSTHDIGMPLIQNMIRYEARSDLAPKFPNANCFRPWKHFGTGYTIGRSYDKNLGIFRDIAGAHSIKNYHRSLQEEINFTVAA